MTFHHITFWLKVHLEVQCVILLWHFVDNIYSQGQPVITRLTSKSITDIIVEKILSKCETTYI